MKKLLIIGVILIVAIGGYLWLTDESAPETAEVEIKNIAGEVLSIENELSALEASVTAGTLTAEQAVSAKSSLNARLASMESAWRSSDTKVLTVAERDAMVATLETIKRVLIRYQSTLVAIDTTAGAEATISGGSITEAFVETVEDYTDQVVDSVQNYDPEPIVLEAETETHLELVESAEDQLEAELEATTTTTTTVTADPEPVGEGGEGLFDRDPETGEPISDTLPTDPAPNTDY